MRWIRSWLGGWMLGLAVLAGTSMRHQTGETPSQGRESCATYAVDLPAQHAIKGFLDPVTGKRLEGPPAAPESQPPVPPPAAMGIPADWLKETPGETPGGGIKLNFQGRFRQSSVGRVDDSGAVVTLRCEDQMLGTQSVETPSSTSTGH